MMQKYYHPLVIGFLLSLTVTFLFVKFYPKYHLEILQETNLSDKSEMYFYDLNGDGNSEKIHYCHYDNIFQPTLYLYNSDDNFMFLWNFMEHPVKNCSVFSGDYNNDQLKEIFIFTEKSDSIFLYVLNPENDREFVVNREYVVKVSGQGQAFQVIPIGLYDLNFYKNKEFLFAIDAGYPNQPRRLYHFDISNRALKSSANIEAKITTPIVVEDLNNDGNAEILVSNQSVKATNNGNQAQILVLNHNLEYLFNPIYFYGSPSRITIGTVLIEGKKQITALNSGLDNDNIFNNLMIYDLYGKRILDKSIDEQANLVLLNIDDPVGNLFLFSGYKLNKYNSSLDLTKTYAISNKNKVDYIFSENINKDTLNEFVFIGKNDMVVLSGDIKKKTTLSFDGEGKIGATVSKINNIPNKVSVQIGSKWYLIKYLRSKSFVHSKLFAILIFTIILITMGLIFRRKYLKIYKSILKNKDGIDQAVIEEDIDGRFTGIKNKLDTYRKKTKDDSLNKVIDDIDDTFEEVKKISMKIINEEATAYSTANNFTELIKEKKNDLNITAVAFPGNCWSELKKEIKKIIIETTEITTDYLSKHHQNADVKIQMVSHFDYINLIFEIEEVYLKKGDLNEKEIFGAILKNIKGKYRVENIAEFGTIINISFQKINVPIKNQKTKRIKVILAEDHDVSLFGLLSFFKTRDDIEVVGTAKNGMEVLKILESKKTDIVITDISMPGMGGIELSERLQEDYPDIKIVVFTMYLENWFIEQLINNGAKGFVSKNSKNIELIGALHNVYEGNNYYCPQFKSKFGFKGDDAEPPKLFESLTKNELRLVKNFAKGLNKSQIAEKMEISKKTIDIFLANILLKLNAGDEDEIISLAKRQKIILE